MELSFRVGDIFLVENKDKSYKKCAIISDIKPNGWIFKYKLKGPGEQKTVPN